MGTCHPLGEEHRLEGEIDRARTAANAGRPGAAQRVVDLEGQLAAVQAEKVAASPAAAKPAAKAKAQRKPAAKAKK